MNKKALYITLWEQAHYPLNPHIVHKLITQLSLNDIHVKLKDMSRRSAVEVIGGQSGD